jgi:enoyl-CoA hydratase/carnithine racemase
VQDLPPPDQVRLSVHDRVGIVTMSDPARRNVLGPDMVSALSAALAELDRDPGVRSIVLRGEGPHFCAGGDITTFERGVAGGRDYVYDVLGVCRLIEHMRRPVIAAVRGYALGGGFELALACDEIVASQTARFGLPELSVGAVPAFALIRLSEITGRSFCKRLAWSQDRLTAAEALERDIVSLVVPDGELDDRVADRAARLAALPRVAAETVKASVNREIADRTLFESATSAAVMWGTQAIAEGRLAFLEKRAPDFPDE